MRKVIVILVLVLIAFGVLIYNWPTDKEKKGEKEGTLFNVSLDKGYFDEFKQIIEEGSPKEKERAILDMAQFAIMLNDTERVVEYLKDVATTAKDENVVAACYAAIDLIRDYYPPEAIGAVVVNVESDFKPGSSVRIVASVEAYEGCTGSVGIKRLHRDLELHSELRYKFELSAGERKEFTFEVVPKKTGEYPLTISLFLSKDRFDYQDVDQKLILRIDEKGGEVIYLHE